MVAHDLRNPIAAVNLTTQLLKRRVDAKKTIAADELLNRIENIRRAADRVSGMINGLLDLAKLKAGNLEIELN